MSFTKKAAKAWTPSREMTLSNQGIAIDYGVF
jgi:hypothetical protein